MEFRLKETPDIALQGKLNHLFTFCNPEIDGYNPAVHEIRKDIKRIKALLRFMKTLFPEVVAQITEETEKVSLFLSPLRESYVNLLVLDQLSQQTEMDFPEIRQYLENENKTLIHKTLVANKGFEELGNLVKNSLDLLKRENFSDWNFEHITEIFAGLYQKCDELAAGLHLDSHAEEWHGLRKKMKALFYQAEYLQEVNPGFFVAFIEKLNLINDELGDDHDIYVFSVAAAVQVKQLNDNDNRLVNSYIAKLVADKRNNLKKLLRDFFAENHEALKKRLLGAEN